MFCEAAVLLLPGSTLQGTTLLPHLEPGLGCLIGLTDCVQHELEYVEPPLPILCCLCTGADCTMKVGSPLSVKTVANLGS